MSRTKPIRNGSYYKKQNERENTFTSNQKLSNDDIKNILIIQKTLTMFTYIYFVNLFLLFSISIIVQYYSTYIVYKEYYARKRNNFHLFCSILTDVFVSIFFLNFINESIDKFFQSETNRWLALVLLVAVPYAYIHFFISKRKAKNEAEKSNLNLTR